MISVTASPEVELTGWRPDISKLSVWVEDWSERNNDRLPLFLPVCLGCGIAIWSNSGNAAGMPLTVAGMGLACIAGALGWERRFSRLILTAVFFICIGFASIAFKSAFLSAPAIEKIWIGSINARILSIEEQSAREIVRLTVDTEAQTGLPEKIRVNIPMERFDQNLEPGAVIRARVRLMPPPGPALPGGYDFSRTSWFQGLGATGSVLGRIEILAPASKNGAFWERTRRNIANHIEREMPEGSGAIGAAFLVGSRGGITEADNEALRNSGMAHLLSVSGLHVTAVVGAAFLAISRLLAIFPWFALRFRVPLFAAGGAALLSICYTLLTGAEVPTIRACVAALLILVALALGREAISLRLLAFGATVVLLFWPEAMAGPSFQLSFAAVGTIIVLHETPWVRRLTIGSDDGLAMKSGRFLLSLLLTGLAIELVLAPIALFHFHKSGLYGALANIAAIPLTTFLIMPLQILALIADGVGAGAPFWWLAGQGIFAIRGLAYWVSAFPGSVLSLPSIPIWAFGAIMCGLIWAAIFQGRSRIVAIAPVFAGLIAMAAAPKPDMLLTGDGKHLAVVGPQGDLVLLRAGAGDYAVSMLSENTAISREPVSLDTMPGAGCSADICTFRINRGNRAWDVLATRSRYMVPAMEMAAACRRVDIAVSDRYLPWSCQPRWFKADRGLLEKSGGIAFYLSSGTTRTVTESIGHQPWSMLGKNVREANKKLPPPRFIPLKSDQ